MINTADIVAAARRIEPHVCRTPLLHSAPMSERVGAQIAIKAEHRQLTGSFKLRGALNKVLGLTESDRARGIVTASSGNHGIATAVAARIAQVGCTVYLPTGASPAKVAAIAGHGAEVVMVDDTDPYRAEVEARAGAASTGRTYVSPYNDAAVVAGQGTVGREIDAQAASVFGRDAVDAVVVAVGGGGLISGVATWLATHRPGTLVIGASPGNDAAMAASVAAGRVVDIAAEPTFSDGTAGGIEPDTVTFEPCRTLVGEWVTVSEGEIATAVAAMIDDQHELVEGAAGVALAAAVRWGGDHPGANVVAVSCGANVSSRALAAMLGLAHGPGRGGSERE